MDTFSGKLCTFVEKIEEEMLSIGSIVAAFAASVLLLVGVARWAARRSDNRTFFTARRNAAWYEVWPAMIAAAMSGITFVSVPGSVAADSFSYLQMVLGFTVGQLLVAFWLVPLFYRLQVTSIYEYFDHRFGPTAHRLGGWLFLCSKLMAASLKLYIVVVVMQQLLFARLGLPLWVNAVVTVAVAWGYTHRGGVLALLRADVVKSCCMLAALGVTMAALLDALGWSVAEGWHELTTSPMSQLFFFEEPSSERYFWKMFVGGVVVLVAMTGLDQELMQRNLACRSVGDAQKNIVLTAVSQAVVIALFLGLGWLLWRYAEVAGLPIPERADTLFPSIAVGGGLPWMVGVLFVMGFASGSFSAGGGALTALTTSVLFDLGKGARCEMATLTRRRQGVHALLAVVMVGLVLLFDTVANQSVINLLYRVAGYTYGPILGLFLFGCWSRRMPREAWVWLPVVVAPLLAWLLQAWLRAAFGYGVGFELLLVNALITMAGLWMVSRRPTA